MPRTGLKAGGAALKAPSKPSTSGSLGDEDSLKLLGHKVQRPTRLVLIALPFS